jgi:hypothetical protein
MPDHEEKQNNVKKEDACCLIKGFIWTKLKHKKSGSGSWYLSPVWNQEGGYLVIKVLAYS